MYIRINMSKTDFIYLNIWCDSKYITIKQLNEWVKQFTLSVYASKYNYHIKPCTYKWVFSNNVCIILSHDTLGVLWVQHNWV